MAEEVDIHLGIISKRRPSVSRSDLMEYERVRNEFSLKEEGRRPVSVGFR